MCMCGNAPSGSIRSRHNIPNKYIVFQMKSVRVGRNNRRIRIEGEDCDDWMAVEMGKWIS